MAAFIDKRSFRIVMWLCMFMHVLVLSPHHHHGEAGVPCLNFMHCTAAGATADCGTDMVCGAAEGHRHNESESDKHGDSAGHRHDAKDDACSVNDIDLARAAREDGRPNLLSDSDILLYAVFLVGAEEDPCGHCRIDNISELSIRRNTGVPPAHIAYIAAAMPPRAPSFTA